MPHIKKKLHGPSAMEGQNAIHSELDYLKSNKTWELAPLPLDQSAINAKWIFRIKTKADGSIDKYKV